MKKGKWIVFIFGWMSLIMLSGCVMGIDRYESRNHRADDVISKAIYEEFGGKELHYQGRDILTDEGTFYGYVINEIPENMLQRVLRVVNDTLDKENIHNKINISFYLPSGGGAARMLTLTNYSEETMSKSDFDAVQHLWIGADQYRGGIFFEPDTYKNLNGIKYLEISGELQDYAEKKGVDWFEYLPDLERLDVDEKTIHTSMETDR